MSWWSRLANVFQPDRLDRELDEEQRFHIETRADELEARGLSREAALKEAERQFGPRLQLRESSRDVRLMPWLESLGRDLRLGLRLLRKDTIVSTAAVVSLGLAIGACTAAFSLIDALVLRQLPVPEPDRLVYLSRPATGGDPSYSTMCSYPFFERVRQATAPHLEAFSMSHQSLAPGRAAGCRRRRREAADAVRVGQCVQRARRHAGPRPRARAIGRRHARWASGRGRQPRLLDAAAWRQSGRARPMDSLEQKAYQIVGVAQAGFTGAQPGR